MLNSETGKLLSHSMVVKCKHKCHAAMSQKKLLIVRTDTAGVSSSSTSQTCTKSVFLSLFCLYFSLQT